MYPADTGRSLNVHKTFRRLSGRLQNVLCTFNLHPVSTGCLVNKLTQSRPEIAFYYRFEIQRLVYN